MASPGFTTGAHQEERIMDGFFQRYKDSPILLSAEEILPQDLSSASDGSVYVPYLRTLQPTSFDFSLRPYRRSALAGALQREDFAGMRTLLGVAKRQIGRAHVVPIGIPHDEIGYYRRRCSLTKSSRKKTRRQ